MIKNTEEEENKRISQGKQNKMIENTEEKKKNIIWKKKKTQNTKQNKFIRLIVLVPLPVTSVYFLSELIKTIVNVCIHF